MKMLQQLIFEVKEIQRSSEKKKVKITPMVDSDGNITYKPMHRSAFRRPIVQPDYTLSSSDTKFYFDDLEEFRRQYNDFNNKDRNIEFHCVGYANIRLRFCGRCFDANKDLPLDLYFVNRKPNEVIPQTLCLGCLGVYLKEHRDEMNHIQSAKDVGSFEPSNLFPIGTPESTL